MHINPERNRQAREREKISEWYFEKDNNTIREKATFYEHYRKL